MQYRAALSRISHAKNRKADAAGPLQAGGQPGKRTSRCGLSRSTRRRCATPTRSISTTCCWKPCGCCATTKPRARAWNRRLSYVMVDEYQDTNRSQYELMRLLTEAHGNVCVVGDEDQSIYSWRGADIRNILDFERDFPNARTIRLEQNYRSTKNILAAAGAVVENNKARKGKKLWTEADAGRSDRPLCRVRRRERSAVHRRHQSKSTWRPTPDDHVAVLYRTNSQSRQIEEALRRYGRKYNVVGGFSFYQRAEIKDTVAYPQTGCLQHGFGQPAAHHQHAGARHRPHHRGADRAIRARARHQPVGRDRQHHRRPGALRPARSPRWSSFRNLMQELSLVASTSAPAGPAALHSGPHRLSQDARAGEDARSSESRLENLDELINAAAEAAERGESAHRFSGSRRAGGRCRRLRRERRRSR